MMTMVSYHVRVGLEVLPDVDGLNENVADFISCSRSVSSRSKLIKPDRSVTANAGDG